MNTTYKRIWDDADRQWKYSKSFYQVQFLFPRAVMPSPWRILYYLVKHIHNCKRKQTGENKQDEIYQTYKKTLVEIITVKLTSDYENSIEEDFEDLRQDIRNHITEKQKHNEDTVSEHFHKLKETIAEHRKNETMLREEIRVQQGDIAGLKEELKSQTEELKDIKDLLKTLLKEKRGE